MSRFASWRVSTPAVELGFGEVPQQIEVREGNVRWIEATCTGQKNGAFLEQSDNRELEATLVPDVGSELDSFAYIGSIALHLATRASSVTALDISADALLRGAENARLNQLDNIEWVAGDAFDVLPEWGRQGRGFDVVVVDPPAFAKSKRNVPAALRGYHEINRRAMRLVSYGGWLVTASCSFHIQRPQFMEMIANAAAASGRWFTLHRIIGQGIDHPEIITVPETGYLKGVVLRAD